MINGDFPVRYVKWPNGIPNVHKNIPIVWWLKHVETLKSQLTSSLIINISRVSDAAISHLPHQGWVPPTTESLEVALPSSWWFYCPCWRRWSSPKMGWYTKKILADWNILVTLKKIEHNLPFTISVGFEQSLFLLVIYFNSHTKRNPIGMEYQHISEPWVLGDWAFEPLNNKITIHRVWKPWFRGVSPVRNTKKTSSSQLLRSNPGFCIADSTLRFEINCLTLFCWAISGQSLDFLERCWVAPVFIFDMVQYWCAFHSLMLLWTWNQWHRLRNNMHCTCSKAISSQVKLGRS